MKSLLESPLVQFLIGRTLGAWMRIVGWTTRWETLNRSVPEALMRAGGPVILVYWHGRVMLAHSGWVAVRGRMKTHMLISQSRDGAVVAHAARTVGMELVRGSTAKEGKDKGGFEAMRAMIRVLREGGSVAITPDGPKGPRMRAEMGAIQLAKLTGAPIMGLAWSTQRRRVLNSWDRFVLPGPFGRGVYMFGDLIRVDRRADDAAMEAARLAMETELIRITQEADRRAGVTPVEPAEARAPHLEASPA